MNITALITVLYLLFRLVIGAIVQYTESHDNTLTFIENTLKVVRNHLIFVWVFDIIAVILFLIAIIASLT